MKKLVNLLAGSLVVIMILSVAALADEGDSKEPQEQTLELQDQTVCPVMGGKINKDVYTDIQGQRVYHCCAGCQEPMKTDPDKYFKKAAEAGVRFESIQTLCPISGKSINEEVSTYFEGRTVKFCCDGCIAEFDKDPQKYLTMIDKPADSKMDKKMHGEMHHGESDKMEHEGQDH